MTARSTSPAATAREAVPGSAGPPGTAGLYPALGQVATTTSAMRAAADLIERSGVAGLSVTCYENCISIQVSRGGADASSRAAAVAHLAGLLGGIAVQDDHPEGDSSSIKAHGSAGGLRVDVFTALTVQQGGTDPSGQRLLLAVTPDGQVTPIALARGLPTGWRWLTELDPAHPAAPSDTAAPSAQLDGEISGPTPR